MECSFTEKHYKDILNLFLERDYKFTSFSDFSPGSPRQIILRHDIDLSLNDALRIAELEAELGIKSVFQIMVTAEVYNPASFEGSLCLQKIRNLGHYIGLHLDPMALGLEKTGSEVNLNEEQIFLKLLSFFEMAKHILGELDSYSLHRPAATGLMKIFDFNLKDSFPPYAYAKTFMEEIIYRSDSARRWRHGCICSQIDELNNQSIQLLIHPIWWTKENLDKESVLNKFAERQMSIARNYIQSNIIS